MENLSQYKLLAFAQSEYGGTSSFNEIAIIPYCLFKSSNKRFNVTADGENGYGFSYSTDTTITVRSFGDNIVNYTAFVYGVK